MVCVVVADAVKVRCPL